MAVSSTTIAEEKGQDLSALVAQLGKPNWDERHAARDELIKDGLAGRYDVGALVREMLKSDDPEVRSLLKEAAREVAKETLFNVKKGFLGINLDDNPDPVTVDGKRYFPVRIVAALEDYPAKNAGVKDGSLILKIDETVCDGGFNTQGFVDYISRKHPGDTVTLTLWVDGRTELKAITLGERPEDGFAASIEYRKEEFFRRWFDREVVKAMRERSDGR